MTITDGSVLQWADGLAIRVDITGEADVVPGPLTRFTNLLAELDAEGADVPAGIRQAITAEHEGRTG